MIRKSIAQAETGLDEQSWREKFLAIIKSQPAINSIVALGIAVGFFHGWLKIHVAHWGITFLFDALLMLALVMCYSSLGKGSAFFPAGPIGAAIKRFVIFCCIYLWVPWGMEPIIGVAAVRGWCFSLLMFALGYHLTVSLAQVKGYFYFLILLGVLTAVYGIRQSPEEIERMMQENALFAERYITQFYVTSQGRELRRFSTFISSGGFGAAMAYVMIFIVVLASAPRTSGRDRFVLLLALVPVAYGLVLSGARSALMNLMFGFVVIAWKRRNLQIYFITPAAFAVALFMAASFTKGSALERYSTLLDFEEIYQRNAIPTEIGWKALKERPMGGGLGRSGYSLPFILSKRVSSDEWLFSDGDLGRLMIEMGIPGLIFFGAILWQTFRLVYKSIQELSDSAISTLALACGACIVIAFSSIPSGSPFLGIPTGALVWFLVGTLQKLYDENKQLTESAVPPELDEDFDEKKFLYHRPIRRTPDRRRPA